MDRILLETIYFVCFSVLISNTYPSLNYQQNNGVTHGISMVKWFFLCLEKKHCGQFYYGKHKNIRFFFNLE